MRHDRIQPVVWFAAAMAAAAPAAAEPEPASVAEIMAMDVCTGPDDHILPGLAPIDPGCSTRRKIRPGEAPPYRLRDWPPATGGCRDGLTVKYNIPITRAGETRIVSFTDRASGAGCEADSDPESETSRGLSVQWHDGEFGFIMASWSPVAMSSFESALCGVAPGGAERFYRGWVIGPATLPPPGRPGWGVFPSHLATGAAPSPSTPCPARYNMGLTLWMVGSMTFGAAPLPALVSHHYARTDPSGSAPGGALQMERTYWTRAFGLTRWEKWAREDWVHPRSRRAAKDLARTLFTRGRCTPPFALPPTTSPHMTASPLIGDGVWRQVVTDPRSQESHAWVMTLCEDYTNLVRTPPAAATLADGARLNDAYWRAETLARQVTATQPPAGASTP